MATYFYKITKILFFRVKMYIWSKVFMCYSGGWSRMTGMFVFHKQMTRITDNWDKEDIK